MDLLFSLSTRFSFTSRPGLLSSDLPSPQRPVLSVQGYLVNLNHCIPGLPGSRDRSEKSV